MECTWCCKNTFSIGGLVQVGFAVQSDFLLVASHQGRGVFDCLTGQKVARDASDSFDDSGLIVDGIGPLVGQRIRTAGLFGGSLPKTTADGWKLIEKPGASTRIFLAHESWENDVAELVGDEGVCELRAFGFSDTSNSLVIGTTCDLTIYARAAIVRKDGKKVDDVH